MRIPRPVLIAGILLAAACSNPERATISAPRAPFAPQFAHTQDLDGTPDLIVDGKRLANSWVIYDENLPANFCSVQEGGVTPGMHRTLRFTVTTPNIGDADVFIGNPLDHVDPNGDGDYRDSDGLYEFASCHSHFHFRNYATYELFPVGSSRPILARKRGFCMIDITPWNDGVAPSSWVYRSCGSQTAPGFQGISVGYADTYNKHLGGQYFLLDDPAEPVSPGDYIIRITVNPPFTARGKEVCPVTDSAGFCHMFRESNYDNNVAEVRITIPNHTGKTGFGPGADNQAGTEILDDENRPDKT